MRRIPATFQSLRAAEPEAIPIVIRDDLDAGYAASVVEAVHAVAWAELVHAYGPAGDVAAQLIAVVVGDDTTREAAWWNLFGNIHHQGTIYEATVPAVPIMARLAGWHEYPDRVDALAFLEAVAKTGGVVVWSYDGNGGIAHDEERQASLAREVEAELSGVFASLLRGWQDESDAVKRASLMVLAHSPNLTTRDEERLAAIIPPSLRRAWSPLRAGSAEDEEEFDALNDLEEWAFSP